MQIIVVSSRETRKPVTGETGEDRSRAAAVLSLVQCSLLKPKRGPQSLLHERTEGKESRPGDAENGGHLCFANRENPQLVGK